MKKRIQRTASAGLNQANVGLCTYAQIAEAENLGLNTVMRLAKESGALVKIGKTARVEPKTFHEYVMKNYRVSI
ncbi:MAG: DUF6462 family protein [Lachnospiraceae bacterium]|nr:DUF6462 family protein [Lachnospiraceae bacterium]